MDKERGSIGRYKKALVIQTKSVSRCVELNINMLAENSIKLVKISFA